MIKSKSPPKNMFSKPEVEENFLNLIKGTYLKKKTKKKKKQNPAVSIILSRKRLNASLLISAMRQEFLLHYFFTISSLFLFYIVLDVLAMKQEKK